MFQDPTTHLSCEIRTLAYPKAAVFAFCLALLVWNLNSVLLASLEAVHGEDTVKQNVSGYIIILPVSGNLPSPSRHDDRDPRETLDRLPILTPRSRLRAAPTVRQTHRTTSEMPGPRR